MAPPAPRGSIPPPGGIGAECPFRLGGGVPVAGPGSRPPCLERGGGGIQRRIVYRLAVVEPVEEDLLPDGAPGPVGDILRTERGIECKKEQERRRNEDGSRKSTHRRKASEAPASIAGKTRKIPFRMGEGIRSLHARFVRSGWRRKVPRKRDLLKRRGRDSNSRYRFTPYDGLANRCLQPLGHLSGDDAMRGETAMRIEYSKAARECQAAPLQRKKK